MGELWERVKEEARKSEIDRSMGYRVQRALENENNRGPLEAISIIRARCHKAWLRNRAYH